MTVRYVIRDIVIKWTLIILYFFSSKLEYFSIVWCPFYQVHIIMFNYKGHFQNCYYSGHRICIQQADSMPNLKLDIVISSHHDCHLIFDMVIVVLNINIPRVASRTNNSLYLYPTHEYPKTLQYLTCGIIEYIVS